MLSELCCIIIIIQRIYCPIVICIVIAHIVDRGLRKYHKITCSIQYVLHYVYRHCHAWNFRSRSLTANDHYTCVYYYQYYYYCRDGNSMDLLDERGKFIFVDDNIIINSRYHDSLGDGGRLLLSCVRNQEQKENYNNTYVSICIYKDNTQQFAAHVYPSRRCTWMQLQPPPPKSFVWVHVRRPPLAANH